MNTLDVLKWAKQQAGANDTVKVFWEKLADAVDEPVGQTPERILSELCAYGGNTVANIFRGGDGVAYHEVAKDVAKTLAPMFKKSPYGYDTIADCERYVLEKVGVTNDDINAICDAISKRGTHEGRQRFAAQAGTEATVAAGVGVVVVNGAVALGGQVAVEKAVTTIGAEKLAEYVAAQVVKQAAQKAAQEVGKKAAQEAAKRVAQEVAKQVVARIIAATSIFLAMLTAISLAGPAMRKTIPGVTYIALIRKLYEADQLGF